MPTGRALHLICDELTAADVDGRPGFRLGEVTPARGIRLLPAFDNYVIGYRNRAALLAEPLHRHVYHGGMIRPTVVADGQVVATWSLDRPKGRVVISAFESLTPRVRRAVESEVADVGRFLDRELTVALAEA